MPRQRGQRPSYRRWKVEFFSSDNSDRRLTWIEWLGLILTIFGLLLTLGFGLGLL